MKKQWKEQEPGLAAFQDHFDSQASLGYPLWFLVSGNAKSTALWPGCLLGIAKSTALWLLLLTKSKSLDFGVSCVFQGQEPGLWMLIYSKSKEPGLWMLLFFFQEQEPGLWMLLYSKSKSLDFGCYCFPKNKPWMTMSPWTKTMKPWKTMKTMKT